VDKEQNKKKQKKQKNKKAKEQKSKTFFGGKKTPFWHKKGKTGKVRTVQRNEENGDGKEASQAIGR
jgi:hypothetical protein